GRGFRMSDLVAALEGSGHIEVKDGKIEGTNVMEEVTTLLKVAGLSLDHSKFTAFSIAETDFSVKQGIINLQKLFLDDRDFQATGKGTVGFDQKLNLNVNLSLSPALSQKIVGSSSLGKLALKDGRLRLPLLITGTAQAPVYQLEMAGLTGRAQEEVEE